MAFYNVGRASCDNKVLINTWDAGAFETFSGIWDVTEGMLSVASGNEKLIPFCRRVFLQVCIRLFQTSQNTLGDSFKHWYNLVMKDDPSGTTIQAHRQQSDPCNVLKADIAFDSSEYAAKYYWMYVGLQAARVELPESKFLKLKVDFTVSLFTPLLVEIIWLAGRKDSVTEDAKKVDLKKALDKLKVLNSRLETCKHVGDFINIL